jgi:hypothetical protein
MVMRTSPVPFDSDALRANIATTAQQVVIPDRYLPLIEAVQGYYGVRTPLTATLAEHSPTVRSPDARVEDGQTSLPGNSTCL